MRRGQRDRELPAAAVDDEEVGRVPSVALALVASFSRLRTSASGSTVRAGWSGARSRSGGVRVRQLRARRKRRASTSYMDP